MNGLRFKVGEVAIYAVAWCPEAQWAVGRTVIINEVGPVVDGEGRLVDYFIDVTGDRHWGSCYDWQLRKLDPPAEPESITRREEIEA